MVRLTVVLAISLILHLILYEGILNAPDIPRPQTTTVELVEKPEPKQPHQKEKNFERAVVKNTTKEEPKELKDPAQFIAEKNQRVQKQTRATHYGVFQNASPATQAAKKLAQQDAPEKPQQRAQKSPANDGDTPEFERAIQDHMAVEQVMASSVPYELPSDIAAGTATNLNADAHIYASFYNRILDLFYVRWAEKLDYIWDRLSLDQKKQLAGQVWVTDVEIWLDATGLYEKGFIMKNSGFKPFDDAGIGAFKDAKFFPNPPKAKVEPDGHVRLRYRIAVHVR